MPEGCFTIYREKNFSLRSRLMKKKYINQCVTLPVTPANMLRFLISILDFVILLILLWRYIYELRVMAIVLLLVFYFVSLCVLIAG